VSQDLSDWIIAAIVIVVALLFGVLGYWRGSRSYDNPETKHTHEAMRSYIKHVKKDSKCNPDDASKDTPNASPLAKLMQAKKVSNASTVGNTVERASENTGERKFENNSVEP
jgi:hypothetical protein